MKRLISLLKIILLVPLLSQTALPQNAGDIDQLMIQGHYSDALQIVQSVIENDTSNAEVLYKGGLIYQNLLQYGKATEYLEQAARIAPDRLDIRYALGKNYYNLDRFSEARREMEKVFNADSTHLSAGTFLGMSLMKMSEFQEADRVHQSLISQDVTNAHAYKQLAISAFKQGKDSTSIANTAKYVSKFERYSPVADPDVLYYSAKNDLRVGRVESAKTGFRWGIRNFPHQKVLHAELAKLLYGQQQYEPAIEPFEQLIALGDSTAGVYQHLGFCYYYTENMVRARNAFRKSFSKDPSTGLTAYYLAITERETGNLSSAIHFFEKAEELSYASYLGDLYTQMATAYQEAKNFNKSVWAYKQAMEFQNNPRNTLFHIATLYDDEIQNPEKALDYYQQFLEHSGATKPENKNYAQERVSKLKTKIFLQN